MKDNTTEVMLEENEHYSLERLVQCKYFECLKYEIKDEVKIVADESSFVSLVFIEGSGTIEADDYKQEVLSDCHTYLFCHNHTFCMCSLSSAGFHK